MIHYTKVFLQRSLKMNRKLKRVFSVKYYPKFEKIKEVRILRFNKRNLQKIKLQDRKTFSFLTLYNFIKNYNYPNIFQSLKTYKKDFLRENFVNFYLQVFRKDQFLLVFFKTLLMKFIITFLKYCMFVFKNTAIKINKKEILFLDSTISKFFNSFSHIIKNVLKNAEKKDSCFFEFFRFLKIQLKGRKFKINRYISRKTKIIHFKNKHKSFFYNFYKLYQKKIHQKYIKYTSKMKKIKLLPNNDKTIQMRSKKKKIKIKKRFKKYLKFKIMKQIDRNKKFIKKRKKFIFKKYIYSFLKVKTKMIRILLLKHFFLNNKKKIGITFKIGKQVMKKSLNVLYFLNHNAISFYKKLWNLNIMKMIKTNYLNKFMSGPILDLEHSTYNRIKPVVNHHVFFFLHQYTKQSIILYNQQDYFNFYLNRNLKL